MSRRNPRMSQVGLKQRKRHKSSYYTAQACIAVSPAVKHGLVEIAEIEGRSLSWVVAEVFKFYFGLKDDTPYEGLLRPSKVTKLKLVRKG